MQLYLEAFLVAWVANSALLLPFLLWHGTRPQDALGGIGFISTLGLLAVWRYDAMTRRAGTGKKAGFYLWATFPTVFSLVLQAVLWTAVTRESTGTLMPASAPQWAADICALAALAAWIGLPRFLRSRI